MMQVRHNLIKVALVPCLFFTTQYLCAQQNTSTSTTVATSSPFVNLLQVLLALVVVLAVIALFAWGMRRLSHGQHFGGGLVKIRGGVMLGPKERAVLLEVGDTWIVVGVGGGQINALHAMPRPDNVDQATSESSDPNKFGTWLRQAMLDKTKAERR